MATYLFVTFAITAILGFPIWAVLAASSFIALTLGSNTPLIVVVQRLFTAVDSFPILAVPLFMIAGNLMETGGISRRLINFCDSLLGSLTGGLAMVGVLTCMFFAAISGSGPATVAAIGGILIPAMEEAGYDKAFAAAVMAVAGAIGVIIPPSIPMVNFGVVGSVSISTLFAAGFGPGILVGISLMIVCYVTAKKRGYGKANATKFSLANVGKKFIEAFWALLMPVIILGGIYGGIFTPTEAAAVSVVYGFVVGLVIYREMDIKKIPGLFMSAGKSTAMVMMIIATAASFGWILTSERIPDVIAAAMISISSNKIVILLLINILLLIVGCLMETTAAIIILTPIFLPIVTQLGVNPVHFGIIMVVNLAIGMSTPPLGVNLFVACGIAKVSVEQITKAIVWLLIANIIALLLVTYIEPISMGIPMLMGIA
ncbi:TRAP transporter large permease [Anaerotignum faecicola]|nr:TRAP transporter large permease [Anaerotignum faecicola]